MENAPTSAPAAETPETTQPAPTPNESQQTPPQDDSSHNDVTDSSVFDAFRNRPRGEGASTADEPAAASTELSTDASTDANFEPPADWRDSLPKDYRENPYVKRFDSMDAFLKGVENMQGLLGKKGLERPPQDAPPEHWNDYWNAIGRPESPDKYTIENIKDSDESVLFEFDKAMVSEELKVMHRLGLTNEQAQAVFNRYAERQMAMEANEQKAFDLRTEQTLTNLQAEYKDSYDAVIKRALDALENIGIYDTLAKHKLDTDESFIRFGIKLSEQFGEAVVGEGASVKDRISRLDEIENSKAFLNARDPNHDKVVAERLRILKEIHNG